MDEQTARHHLGPLSEVVDNPDISIHHFLEALGGRAGASGG
jgi:hypothetical protein